MKNQSLTEMLFILVIGQYIANIIQVQWMQKQYHINYAFLDVDKNGDLQLTDEYADFQMATLPELEGLSYGAPYAGVIGALIILKIKNPHLKLGISVGGWSKTGNFHDIAKDKVKRQNFASNLTKFIDYIGFDFVDIDWEHPTVSRDGCPGGPEDTENFTLLMKGLRNALDNLGEKMEDIMNYL